MKITSTAIQNEKTDVRKLYLSLINDIKKITHVLNGRVRFGTGVDGVEGQNIQGTFQQFTTDAVADTEETIAHGIGLAIPIGYIIIWQDKAGTLYQGPTTGTDWDTTNIYLKCDVASVTFLIFILK